ncbi:MAG: hypothetical protein L0Y35_01700 [Flammeovirgaceae bacterium]|nr:hypothetical protein [Flammeovirgaceae bacterium]
MKLNLTLFIIFSFFGFANAQQDTTELDRRNGFKDIKLNSRVDSVKGVIFKKDHVEKFGEKDEFPAKVYEVEHPDYQFVGPVKVNKIELKAYKNLIYEIVVLAAKDPRLMKGMESALGKAEFNVRSDSYVWSGKNLSLHFKPFDKDQVQLTYRSVPVTKMMKEDKKKEVQAVADDF